MRSKQRTLSLSARERVCPHQRDSHIPAKGSTVIFLISKQNSGYRICIPAVSFRSRMKRPAGPRYVDAPKPVYQKLLALMNGKNCFVITTNVDHQFQRAGFDKSRLFYTQGDYGLFQSVNPEIRKTWDNEEWVMQSMAAQGFVKGADGIFQIPQEGAAMRIPNALIPKCPDDGSDVVMNLRSDDSFVEDEGWHRASAAYADFLRRHEMEHVLYLEIGVGANTPVIIKYPFWVMTAENPKAVYACLNYDEAFSPKQIENQSVCIDGDAGEIIDSLLAEK